ncbi:peroxide stress protein YaaA [Glaciecola sp. 1036]|uniref:peroxide stress protein YaaA n=1 Tax=Alteromonadaceae TaxID=72275 RepID=UPI003CFE97DA
MLLVVSPAKNLNYTTAVPDVSATLPRLLQDTKVLVDKCRTLSPANLASLMKISDKLAILNAERFNSFETTFTENNSRPAIFAFNGDVYTGLDANSLTSEDLIFAQQHLRILSGLYGVLRPFDLMQAYRLEMGTKLKVARKGSLYDFWGSKITDLVNQDIAESQSEVLINLASNEYFKAVKPKQLKAKIITPHFKDQKNGQYKIISFFAKKARGLMARYIIQNKLTTTEQLKGFDLDGYEFDANESTETDLVFKRPESHR